jgi:ATP-dependent DNA helicase RecQ
LNYNAINQALDGCIDGKYKFLYLSPERLSQDIMIDRFKHMKINLIAVDEAHCISQWGYDFRPPYLTIADIRAGLPDVPVLALTATSTTTVIDDIQDKLLFKKKNLFKISLQRDNLSYVIRPTNNKDAKMLEVLAKIQGSGIIYTRNRKKTKDIATFLNRNKISADYYHAGLKAEERTAKQKDWIDNKTRIMVATNAFGMGIDKPDVRIVIHVDLPNSIEDYYQEAGRGGRDEKKAYSVVLYNKSDTEGLMYNYNLSFPSFEEIRKVYHALGNYFNIPWGSGKGESYDFEIVEFAENYGINITTAFNCIKMLESEGYIITTDAVYNPSQVKLDGDREVLYDFMLRNEKFEKLIKVLMRGFDGIYDHYVSFYEGQIANHIHSTREEVLSQLSFLHKAGLLQFIPYKDKPQIIYITERLDADALTFDQKMFKFRKDRAKYRIDKMIALIEEPFCRSQQMLRYFGDYEAKECGKCDICQDPSNIKMEANLHLKIKEKVIEILTEKKSTIRELTKKFAVKNQNAMYFVLDEMVQENVIVFDKMYYSNPRKS